MAENKGIYFINEVIYTRNHTDSGFVPDGRQNSFGCALGTIIFPPFSSAVREMALPGPFAGHETAYAVFFIFLFDTGLFCMIF